MKIQMESGEASMRRDPELEVRWRRFAISAKGREAIAAVRRPLFFLLVLNGLLSALVIVAAIARLNWPAVGEGVIAWLR